MFEIGNSLREARLRQGFGLEEAEQATKIRTKYLRALEDERFDILPAQTYVKGFLRTYADYLGLDGQIYVDEYNSRFLPGDDESPLRPSRRRPVARQPRVESSVVRIVLAAIAAATGLVFVAWKWGGTEPDQLVGVQSGPPAPSRQPAAAPVPLSQRWIRLQVTAARGDSLILVHRNSATGRLLYQGTLERGKTATFVGKRLWLNVGEPGNLLVRLNGRRVALPGDGSRPLVALATRQGVARAR